MKREHLKYWFCLEMRSNETVFDHISKHREESSKYDVHRSIFCATLRSKVFDIFLVETKTQGKTDKRA